MRWLRVLGVRSKRIQCLQFALHRNCCQECGNASSLGGTSVHGKNLRIQASCRACLESRRKWPVVSLSAPQTLSIALQAVCCQPTQKTCHQFEASAILWFFNSVIFWPVDPQSLLIVGTSSP